MIARLTILASVICLVLPARGQPYQPVDESDIYEALLLEQQQGYSLTATTNGARLWANIIRRLVRDAAARDPDGPPLFIEATDYYAATLRATGLNPADAPIPLRFANTFHQNSLIEYRRSKVIDIEATDPLPEMALGIKTWWADTLGRPSQFVFDDTTSVPNLHVINDRIITYSLLYYDDMNVIDRMKGLRGRPTSGVLGLLFKVLGPGRVLFSRSTTVDSLQIVYAKAKKIFSKSSTLTVFPDGRTVKGLIDDRPEFRAIEKRLKKDRTVTYRDYDWGDEQMRHSQRK